MTLADLLKDKQHQFVKLKHPIVGNVNWATETSDGKPLLGYTLVFAEGHEKDRHLVVDDTILFCNQWELNEFE